jgi:hypothetical protein
VIRSNIQRAREHFSAATMDATAAADILIWIDALKGLGGDCGGG